MLTYTWNNTGTMANIDQSPSVTGGSATLVVFDSAGAEVYNKDLATDGSFATTTGAAGDWTLSVRFSKMSGTLNFRSEKRTP